LSQCLGALLRFFRDLDTAEEAFQKASLRAVKTWPRIDPTAWLILVGRNFTRDERRRAGRNQALPAEEIMSDLEDAEADLSERIDASHYRDDMLRLHFICCHPELPATQQIALALQSSPVLQSKRSRAPFWWARAPWSSA
jgi:RNA polymerase sigma-70 factor, ECF subfamily